MEGGEGVKHIFVFGSNTAGKHLGGAARHAHDKYGAVMGVGEGPTGDCYAVPTLNGDFTQRTLDEIRESVDAFLLHAARWRELQFYVTRIGCGIAGFTDEQIAPLFVDAPDNCTFDPLWQNYDLPSWRCEL